MTDTRTPAAAKPSAADVRRLVAAELSLPSRLGHTMLLVVSLGGAGVTGALLATEPALPLRTSIALAAMVAVGLSWAAFATWVLTRRRVLLAEHRVVAARMATGFTALFTLGAWGIGRWGEFGRGADAAVAVGLVMLAVAVSVLVRARRRFHELSRRRAELERRLADRGGAPR